MLNIVLVGFNGAMGKSLVELISEADDMVVSAGVDRESNDLYDFPQYTHFSDSIQGDVIIDFSHYSVVPSLLDFCESSKIPAVICTTGLTEDIIQRIETVSKETALFRSGNMSLGINLLIDLVKKAAAVLQGSYDMEIIEKHHNKKVDAPSGTAKMIANAMKSAIDSDRHFTYGREGNDTKRTENEIGIHAVRGGTIVGEHDVIFAGIDEVIEIRHQATSKRVFAQGALQAARFMAGRKPGLYDMNDVL